jgi:uncharacterized protein (DUF983 family)
MVLTTSAGLFFSGDRMKNAGKDGKPVFAFLTRSRCPACGSIRTIQRSTQRMTQYRKCLVCGERYKVAGIQI